jgi:carbon starvation protein
LAIASASRSARDAWVIPSRIFARADLYGETLAAGNLPAGIASAEVAQRFIFNDRVDAAVAAFFMVSVIIIIADSAKEWWKVVSGRMPPVTTEHPFEPRTAVAGD